MKVTGVSLGYFYVDHLTIDHVSVQNGYREWSFDYDGRS